MPIFSPSSARRISAAVRKVERQGTGGIIRRGKHGGAAFPFSLLHFWASWDASAEKIAVNEGVVAIHGPSGSTRIAAAAADLSLPGDSESCVVYVSVNLTANTATIAVADSESVPDDLETEESATLVVWLQSFDIADEAATRTDIHNMGDVEIIPRQAAE